MASLFDTINKNRTLVKGPGGLVTEESKAGLQELSKQYNVQQPTTAPTAATLPNTTPKQIQMASSPQAQQAALSTILRREDTPKAQFTQDQSKEVQNIKKAGQLSSVADRVSNFIDIARNKLQTQATSQLAPEVSLGQQGSVKLPPNTDTFFLKTKIQDLLADPTNTKLMVEVNSLLGQPASTILTGGQLQSLYAGVDKTITSGVGSTIDRNLTVSDLASQPEFGMSLKELGQLLGKPETEVGALGLSQLETELSKAGQGITTSISNQELVANDLLRGQAERKEARQLGREQSQLGLDTATNELNTLLASVDAAQEVTFGGQRYNIDTLLGDEGITQLVQDYLVAPEDSTIRKTLAQTEPELVKYIETHKTALSALNDQLSQTASKLQGVQDQRASVAKIGNSTLPDSIMKALLPDWGQLSSIKIDPNSIPVLKVASTLAIQDADKLSQVLTGIATKYPELLPQLKKLTTEEIKGLLNDTNIQALDTVKSQVKLLEEFHKNPNKYTDQILTELIGMDMASAQKMFEEDKQRLRAGLPTSGISRVLDKNADGKIDSPAILLSRLRGQLKTLNPTLSSVGKGELKGYTTAQIGASTSLSKADQALRAISNVGTYHPTTTDWLQSGMDLETTADIIRSGKWNKVSDPRLASEIKTHFTELVDKHTGDLLAGYPIDTYKTTGGFTSLLNNPNIADKAKLGQIDMDIATLTKWISEINTTYTAAEQTKQADLYNHNSIQTHLDTLNQELKTMMTTRQQWMDNNTKLDKETKNKADAELAAKVEAEHKAIMDAKTRARNTILTAMGLPIAPVETSLLMGSKATKDALNTYNKAVNPIEVGKTVQKTIQPTVNKNVAKVKKKLFGK